MILLGYTRGKRKKRGVVCSKKKGGGEIGAEAQRHGFPRFPADGGTKGGVRKNQ